MKILWCVCWKNSNYWPYLNQFKLVFDGAKGKVGLWFNHPYNLNSYQTQFTKPYMTNPIYWTKFEPWGLREGLKKIVEFLRTTDLSGSKKFWILAFRQAGACLTLLCHTVEENLKGMKEWKNDTHSGFLILLAFRRANARLTLLYFAILGKSY